MHARLALRPLTDHRTVRGQYKCGEWYRGLPSSRTLAGMLQPRRWKAWDMDYKRQVAMRCDGDDFGIALLPEDEIVFRTKDARAMRNLCRRLRWQITVDTTLSTDDWTWPPDITASRR